MGSVMTSRTWLVAVLAWTSLLIGCGRDDDVFGDDEGGEGGLLALGGYDGFGAGGTTASGSGGTGLWSPSLGGFGGEGAGDTGTGAGGTGTGAGGTGAGSGSGSSGGGGAPLSCEPRQPAPGCGPGMHCFATESGQPDCVGPVGSGQQNDSCTADTQCAAELVCVTGNTAKCCMSWCLSSNDCPSGESCYPVAPPLYVGPQEYGVCYDPFWCGVF